MKPTIRPNNQPMPDPSINYSDDGLSKIIFQRLMIIFIADYSKFSKNL